MKRLFPYLIASLMIIATYAYVFIRSDLQNVTQLEESFNEQQAIHVEQAAIAIENHFDWQVSMLSALSALFNLSAQSDMDWESILVSFNTDYVEFSEYPALAFFDASGELAYFNASETTHLMVEPTDFQQYIENAIVNEGNVYVSPIISQPETQYYVIFLRLNSDGSDLGYLAMLVDFGVIIEQHVTPIRSGEFGAAWLQDHDGVVVYDHETEIIGQSVYDLHAAFPEILAYNDLYLTQLQGTGEYSFTVQRNGDVSRKLLAWDTAAIGDVRLTVAMSAPDSEVSTLVSSTRRIALLGGGALFLLLVVGGYGVASWQQRQLQILVDNRTSELQAERRLLVDKEKTLRLALDAGKAGMWVWDIPDNKITWDDMVHVLYGVPIGTFEGNYEGWRKRVHPEDVDDAVTQLNKATSGDANFDTVFRIIQPDGAIRILQAHALVLRDPVTDDPLQMIGLNIDITERKEAEQALRENEAMLQSLLDNQNTYIIRTDIQGVITYVNDVWMRDFGFLASDFVDFIGRPSLETVAPEDHQSVRDAVAECIANPKKTITVEIRKPAPNNTVVWSVWEFIAVRDEYGTVKEIQCVGLDITERVESQQQLQQYSKQLETLRDINLILSSTLNLDEVLNSFLVELEKVTPYTSASIFFDDGSSKLRFMAGRHLPEIVDVEGIAEKLLDSYYYNNIKQTLAYVYVEDVTKDELWNRFGQTNYIYSWVGFPLLFKGKFLGVLNLDHHESNFFTEEHLQLASAVAAQAASAIENAQLYGDLEARVEQRTQALRESQAKERALLEAIPDAVFRIDRAGKIVDSLVHSHERIYGQLEALSEQHVQDVFSPDNAKLIMRMLVQCLRMQKMQTFSFPKYLPDDVRIYLEVRMVAISDHEVMALIRDMSQEQALKEQRERFIANAAHELKTPLSIILTKTFLIRKKPENLERHLSVIDEVGENMKHLISELLDITRFESGTLTLNKTLASLPNLIETTVGQVATTAEEKGLAIHMELNHDLPLMPIDTLRITQVVTNLLVNAINYTEDGYIKVTLSGNNDSVALAVMDTGVGIPPEYLEEIFLPFNRAHRQSTAQGTGLGLAISKETVERHGGAITVESEVDKGSTFTMTLPMED